MLRRVHRLLLAVIAVVVCVAVTGPFRGIAGVRASIAIAGESTQSTQRWLAPSSDDAHSSADLARPDGDDLEAIENEAGDEEDDALNDVADEAAFALACVQPPENVPPRRVEIFSDPSRASSRTTHARGPPA